jgi:hypothetical protein
MSNDAFVMISYTLWDLWIDVCQSNHSGLGSQERWLTAMIDTYHATLDEER